MKQLLITIAAVVLVGCGESQQSVPAPEAKPAEPVAEVPAQPLPPVDAKPDEPVAEASQPEPPTAKASDISIHQAAKKGDIEAIKQHLAAGTDVDEKYGDLTPLHFAAVHGRKEVVELLIATGADVNAKLEKGMFKGMTPLDRAVQFNEPETADLLRKHGGKTGEELSIYLAAMYGTIEAVKQHLNDGAEVNAKDSDGHTPLHLAADGGHEEIVELLIANGADVNAKDDDGYTPLHYALRLRKEVAELLISKGADVNAEENGITPLDFAIELSDPEAAKLLRKHGGKTGEELKAEGK